MLIFSPEGPRHIDTSDVVAVYRGGGDGRYTFATLVLANGSEVAGAVANEALGRLEATLADVAA